MTKLSDAELEKLWDEFAYVDFDQTPDGRLVLRYPWHRFISGTSRSEIVKWFDEHHSKGVRWLISLYGIDPTDC